MIIKKRFSQCLNIRHKIKILQRRICQLEYALIVANKTENELRLDLLTQINHTTELERELADRKLPARRSSLLVPISSNESINLPRNEFFEDTIYPNTDPKTAFGTVSTELMQYRYEELTLSHQRCLLNLSKKDTKLKALQIVIDRLCEEIDSWRDTNRWLEKRTEILCCKYLALRTRKEEEVLRLKTELEGVEQMVAYLKTSRHSNLENLIESVEKRDVILLNEMMKCDKLMLKNIQLEKKIQLLQSGIRVSATE